MCDDVMMVVVMVVKGSGSRVGKRMRMYVD